MMTAYIKMSKKTTVLIHFLEPYVTNLIKLCVVKFPPGFFT